MDIFVTDWSIKESQVVTITSMSDGDILSTMKIVQSAGVIGALLLIASYVAVIDISIVVNN